jgi:hypothetical protein
VSDPPPPTRCTSPWKATLELPTLPAQRPTRRLPRSRTRAATPRSERASLLRIVAANQIGGKCRALARSRAIASAMLWRSRRGIRMRSSRRPGRRDHVRGKPIAPQAAPGRAEAIVRATEPDDRYPGRHPREPERSRYRDVAFAVARYSGHETRRRSSRQPMRRDRSGATTAERPVIDLHGRPARSNGPRLRSRAPQSPRLVRPDLSRRQSSATRSSRPAPPKALASPPPAALRPAS